MADDSHVRNDGALDPNSSNDAMDDDALANALAADLSRITSSIPIIPPAKVAPSSAIDDKPAAPVADPALPAQPHRHSLPDDQLMETLDHEAHEPGHQTLNVIEHLESQLRLREEEAQEFRAWEAAMLAIGTADAIAAVEEARPEFTGVLPNIPSGALRSQLPARAGADSGPTDDTAKRSPFAPPPLGEPSIVAPPPEVDAQPDSAPLAPPDHDMFAPRSAAATALDSGFTFNDLIGSGSDEPPAPHRSHGEPGPVESMFVEPLPVMDGEQELVETGSVPVRGQAYEEEMPDDVDETDRAFDGPVTVDPDGVAYAQQQLAPPSGPIATVRVPSDEIVLLNNEPTRQPLFTLEQSGIEPTPIEARVGHAARLFWLWFAANSSVVSIAVGAVLFTMGMSLRQSIVAALAGMAVSFLPLGLGTLAGKRSGQPVMVVSRATFGLLGNVVPAALALITRLFWGALLLWVFASATASILVGASPGGLGEGPVTIIALAIGFLVAVLVALFGYSLIARIQLVLTIVSGILVVGVIAFTAESVNLTVALTTPDGPWILALTGAVLVFSVVGLAWANSSGDLARYQRPGSSGAGSMLWAPLGTTLPAFALIAYGAVLAASNQGLATGLVESPVQTLAQLLPSWFPIPLLGAVGLSLLSGVVITLYSAGFALQSVGVKLRREWSIAVVAVGLLAVSLVIALSAGGGIELLLRDVATTLAVPTAAWAGIFAAEMMIRNRRFDTGSLLIRGGVYPDYHWTNLSALVVATLVGFGLTSATAAGLGWQGYLFVLSGVPLTSDLAGADLGVFAALLIGLLTPIVAGIPEIRRQEEVLV